MTKKPTETTESLKKSKRKEQAARVTGVQAQDTVAAAPGPWDAPWHRREDAAGWETVYRGTGKRRPSRSAVELELTAEQDEWLDVAAEAAGLTLHQFLLKLIDDARRGASAGQPGSQPAGAAG